MMQIDILPYRETNSATNMAEDLLLLEAYPQQEHIRLRHYGWAETNSFTFGYSQHYSWVTEQISCQSFTAIRRPSGGGIVDHRNDWTYALVIPPNHPLHRGVAEEVYKKTHEAIAFACNEMGQRALLAPKRASGITASVPGLCFAAPEPYDVIQPDGLKIAGAAMKRNRHGLLIQGSLEKATTPAIENWANFESLFINALMDKFHIQKANMSDYPEYPQKAKQTAHERFNSKAWNQKR